MQSMPQLLTLIDTQTSPSEGGTPGTVSKKLPRVRFESILKHGM